MTMEEVSKIMTLRDVKELSSTEVNILKQLEKNDDIRLMELIEDLELSKSTISEIVNLFERSGLVVSRKDGREKLISLTKHGRFNIRIISADKRSFLAFL